MAMNILPGSPWRIVGVALIALAVIALVNNFTFLNDLTRRRAA